MQSRIKTSLFAAVVMAAMAVAAPAANAKGCLKGAAAGAVGGHFLHHHGLLGAGIGCAIGHHHAKVKARHQS
jgi:hypothetical protein